jgi:hypothetical protein
MSGLPDEGVSALPADDFDLSPASGHTQHSMAGRALEEFEILPLNPALFQRLELGKNPVTDLEITTVFLRTFRKILRKHPKVNQHQQHKRKNPQKASEKSAEDPSRQQGDKCSNQQEEIQLVIAVPAYHESCNPIFHNITFARQFNSLWGTVPREGTQVVNIL